MLEKIILSKLSEMLSPRLFSAKKLANHSFTVSTLCNFSVKMNVCFLPSCHSPAKYFSRFLFAICCPACYYLDMAAEVTCKYAKLLWCRDDVQLGDTIMDNTIISINYCVAFQYIIKQFTTVNIPYLWSMLHLEYSIVLIFSQVINVNRSFKFLMQHPPSTI